jgi:Sec-independent protein secretion pathway component TatC
VSKEDEDSVEASKAPLMDHLIELRSRLIKALIAFAIAFAFCFFFAKQIYNILVWPSASSSRNRSTTSWSGHSC